MVLALLRLACPTVSYVWYSPSLHVLPLSLSLSPTNARTRIPHPAPRTHIARRASRVAHRASESRICFSWQCASTACSLIECLDWGSPIGTHGFRGIRIGTHGCRELTSSRFQDFKISRFQTFKISKLFNVSRFQTFKIVTSTPNSQDCSSISSISFFASADWSGKLATRFLQFRYSEVSKMLCFPQLSRDCPKIAIQSVQSIYCFGGPVG